MPIRHLHFANKNNASQESDDVISPFAVIVTVSSYSLSQNGWDTLGSPCPLNVGVQDLVTKPQ